MAESLSTDQLGPAPDHKAEAWPEAVPSHMIVTHKGPAEKQFRALQITRLLGDFNGQTVLDVGCDEGYITREIANNAKSVVGYDIKPNALWTNLAHNNVKFTTDRTTVEDHQYNTILLYDVLDHLEGDEPVKFMVWLNSVLAPGGKIFVRTHPWTSRHGGHLYERGLNKAFAHLVFTPDELMQLGFELPPSLRLSRPMATYEYIFAEAGLKIAERKGHSSDQIGSFFDTDILDRIIKVTWKGAIDRDNARKIMANSFIDYSLTTE